MTHHGPELAVWMLDKAAVVSSPGVGFIVGQSGAQGLPGWLNGTIAGGVILVLLYLLKYAIGLWQAKDKALSDAKDERIRQLEAKLEQMENEARQNH